MNEAYVIDFGRLSLADLPRVGGKNASLGEMISRLAAAGIRVPAGFATTAQAYREFLAHDGLAQRIEQRLTALDITDVVALSTAGAEIRGWIEATPLQPPLEASIREAYQSLLLRSGGSSVAVRSSATAEDLPGASFAGQQETYLNVGGIDGVLLAVRRVFASLYNDRAISYRVHRGFRHADVALSAGISKWCDPIWERAGLCLRSIPSQVSATSYLLLRHTV